MAVDLLPKKNSFVSRLIARTQGFLDTVDDLQSLRVEWTALEYAAGGELEISETDLAAFPHLDVAALNAALDTLVALRAALDTGDHLRNLQRLRP
jgi:hypothetical protein